MPATRQHSLRDLYPGADHLRLNRPAHSGIITLNEVEAPWHPGKHFITQ